MPAHVKRRERDGGGGKERSARWSKMMKVSVESLVIPGLKQESN